MYLPWEAAYVQSWSKILSRSRRTPLDLNPEPYKSNSYQCTLFLYLLKRRDNRICQFLWPHTRTHTHTHKRYILHTRCVYAFRMTEATNRENFPTRLKQVCVCNGDLAFLLWGRKLICHFDDFRFVNLTDVPQMCEV